MDLASGSWKKNEMLVQSRLAAISGLTVTPALLSEYKWQTVASSPTLVCHKKKCYASKQPLAFLLRVLSEVRLLIKILTMKTKILLLFSVLITAAFLLVSCYKSKSSYNSTATTSKISITSSGYSPASLTVSSGSTVIWTNNDNVAHTVTTTQGSINSGDIMPGSSYSKTFATAATYTYHDTHNTNMTGVIIVTAASTSGGY
jgi:plastocyanin